MALSEFRDTYSWQGAIELGPHLARLADDLPAAEQTGLALQLRQGMVELAATIAADLQHKGDDVRLLPAFKLVATLELIDKVYPALDTAASRDALDELLERLTGSGFSERKQPPKPAVEEDDEAETPKPAPSSVPVIAAPAEAPAVTASAEPAAVAAPASEPSPAPASATPSAPAAASETAATVHETHVRTESAPHHDHETNPALKVPVADDHEGR